MNHRNRLVTEPEDADLVFPSRTGGPLRRNNFRRRVWLPSLVRAGLLGRVEETDEGWRAIWSNGDGEQSAMCRSHQVAIGYIANKSLGALRFHDLRHSYATCLVSQGVPINVVRTVMGHEQTSTTLDIYTHAPSDYQARVLSAFEGSAVLSLSSEINDPKGGFEGDVRHTF